MTTRQMRWPVIVAMMLLGVSTVYASDYIWLEGEKPATIPAGFSVSSLDHANFLSEGKWLTLSADAAKVDAVVPADGLTLSYPFTVTAGPRELWVRIGYELARAPFSWRLDDGAWKEVTPNDVTVDIMEGAFFNEVAWLKLADVTLADGKHTFEIHLSRFKNAKGESQRILFGLDAICLSSGPFYPHAGFKPGEDGRSAKDDEATKQVFNLPEPNDPLARSSVKLNGLWEICRDDELLPTETAVHIAQLPAHPFWQAIPVPGEKDQLPELEMSHRLWYRTRVNVPASQVGRAFFLVFPCNSMNTTLFVNGTYCGFEKSPLVRIQMDVTKSIKAGVNEICVGIRDIYYGHKADPKDPMVLRKTFGLPARNNAMGWTSFVYPVWCCGPAPSGGILSTPEFVSAGATYASDVFGIPSVAQKQLGLEVTVQNSTVNPVAGEVRCDAVNDSTGKVEKTFAPEPFTLDPAQEKVVKYTREWADPRLWWPEENPNLYRLRTTVAVNGKDVDVKDTLFGFREWSIDGIHMKLNGVNWQGFSEMGMAVHNAGELIKTMRDPKNNYGFTRVWPQHGLGINVARWLGQELDDAFEVTDRNGILIRRSGYLDGEGIGYLAPNFSELGANWIDHLGKWIKGERNHPSIMLWSIENEITYCNAHNLGPVNLAAWEAIDTRAWEAVKKVDPTRPVMLDGGGSAHNTLPIHGDHYSTKPFWNYPQLAYEANAESPDKSWTWDQKRPKFIGEELFAAGINPAYAYFGGEDLFQGKVKSRPSVGKAMQVISQGYRWFGITGCDFCQAPSDSDDSQYTGWAPRAVLVRQWDWTFASGQKSTRTFGIFNGTHYNDPIDFTWALMVDGKKVAGQSTTHNIPAGENEKFDRQIAFPTVSSRQEGQLVLTLAVSGKEVFHDVKEITILPAPQAPKVDSLFVYDPQGNVAAYLKAHGVVSTALTSLTPPPDGKIWLIGKDALKTEEATSTIFASYAMDGGRVIILEQTNPLRYQGLNPAEAESQENEGRTAFVEDTTHPLAANLQSKDFFTWEPGEVVYRNAYLKPSRGAKSLLQCNESLLNSALMVIPVGEGVISLCQAVVAEKLAVNPTAETLFANLLTFSANYKLVQRPVAAAVEPALAKVLDSINLKYTPATDPLAALNAGRIAVISATPANLHVLATNLPKVKQFTQDGGYIVFHGLTPEGMADYNTLVGYDHILRPFRRERVALTLPRNHLMSGISQSDLILYSSQKIFSWASGNYIANDTFSFVVDIDDVAPFAKLNNDFYYNLVNGMVSADGFPYICNHPAKDNEYIFTLPRAEEIVEITWIGNTLWNPTRRIEVIADSDEAGKRTFDVAPNNEAQTLKVEPPLRGTKITVRHALFDDLPDKKQTIGCDNISLMAKRPNDFRERVKPMLNIGGMVEYPQGKGGIVLCNLAFNDVEQAPINTVKKRTVLTTLLRNMWAPFAGNVVIAGAHLKYTPIDLSKQANQYRTEQGWFGDKNFTFKDIPIGAQTFAGVKYNIYDFATSQVPTVLMLGGQGIPNNPTQEVKGIAINQNADALFFLQAARIDQPRNPNEVKAKAQIELAKYVVHYADGKMVDVPIYLEQNIGNYKQQSPAALPGAQIAWVQKYERTPFSAVAYSMQWNNPHPEVTITSVDFVYGKDKRGVPALLAISAAASN